MYASNCINPEIPFLQPEDKGLTALSLFEELNVTEIPMVDNDTYLGLITELDLLDYECIDGQIKEIKTKLSKPFVYETDHFFDVIAKMASEQITVLPVLNAEEKYVGSIDQSSAIEMVSRSEGYRSQGGVLVLEVNIHDYSMAEISRLVESNDVKIIHSYVNTLPDTKMLRVTIKLNTSNLNSIIQTFERFGYVVAASFQKDEFEEDLKKRYEAFLRYLNT